MALLSPTVADRWTQGIGLPSKLFSGTRSDDTELYEEDDAFVLSIEMPGFDSEDIDVTWNEGRLNVAAEHVDEERNRKRTYHRAFRLPKDVDTDGIEAVYENGILEVRLPIIEGSTIEGQPIDVKER
ncbi:MAG: Hsp20/alpha crystallin family protein [Candidatus Nanohaloarchaea archaeon]|nr:Hsp20/alpha crystallin family protein [Candidatus Nanohaloarchaea archaeon]